MRREWRGVALGGLADLLEQRRAQALDELRGDDVGGLLAAADPLPQMIDVELLGHDASLCYSFDWGRSPMPGTAP